MVPPRHSDFRNGDTRNAHHQEGRGPRGRSGPGCASYATTGNAPLAPGQTGTWRVTFTNRGNVAENVAVTQNASGVYTWGQTPVPAGWVSFTPVSASNVAPGGQVIVTVTVSIPANAKPGLHGGTLMGTASAGRTGSGNLISNVGAGDREYIRVG